jgi:cell division protein FtsQ
MARRSPGVDTRLIRRLSWPAAAVCVLAIAGSVASVFGAVVVWQAVRAHPYFAVSEIAVRGNQRIGRDQLLAWTNLRPKMSIWDANPNRIRARLLEHGDIADAAVRRDFPGRIQVHVRERTPLAIALLDDLYYVDRGGQLMNRLDEDDSRDFPLITGLWKSATDPFNSALLRRAARMVRLCQREGCGTGLSEVNIDAEAGVTIVSLRRPVSVHLGWGNWRSKLGRAVRVLSKWEGRESLLALVDASYAHQVVVRLREAPVRRDAPGSRQTKPGLRT